VRSTLGLAAIAIAALLAFPVGVPAQPQPQQPPPQPVPAKRTLTPNAARVVATAEKLNHNTVTVISGNPNGTYIYLAYDMSAVLDDGSELRVLPIIGKGGFQNVLDVLYMRGIDLCITQSNIMSYLKKTGEAGPNIDTRLAYIAKLYNEEMHVLAGPGIKSIKDLDGKKVNFSDVGSGTQFSTRLIFELLCIKATEINVGQADGYQMLKSGEIAATVLIAGKPTGSFQKFKLEPGMTLLPVPYTEVLEQDYFPARLTSDDYPNLIPKGSTVDTIAIGAVLASYNWPRDSARYRRVALFAEAFVNKFSEFHKPARHSKWREANLTTTLRGWKRFPSVEEWLAKNPAGHVVTGAIAIDPVMARAQAAKAAPDNPAEQERLFKQFMEWAKAQQR
jgi:TRAP transporter TAXI family solute receptor